MHDDKIAATSNFLIKTKDLLEVQLIPLIKQLKAEFGIHISRSYDVTMPVKTRHFRGHLKWKG